MAVLGNNWFKTFSLLRLNPESYFDKRKLTREGFCLDILRDIHLDDVDAQHKVCLLLLLQEHVTYLIADVNLLEQIIGSLVDLFKTVGTKHDERLMRSQLIITITSILLTFDFDIKSDLISEIKTLLLKTISNSSCAIVASSACQCLEEIETFYPNLLYNDAQKIVSYCEAHLSPAFQNYAVLLSLCSKNICSFQTSCIKFAQLPNEETADNKEIQLSPLVSYLIELLPLMSPLAVYKVMKNLITVVKNSNISPGAFKLFLPNFIYSSEILYFHLAFDLLDEFDVKLFTQQEKVILLKQLVLDSIHPCLTLFHRMLFLDWMKSCIVNKKIFTNFHPFCKLLLPTPFDGPITQEKKSCLLALYTPVNVEPTIYVEFLSESVGGLKKCALLSGGIKSAASFFRTLFAYFSYQDSPSMHDYLYKLLLSVMKTSPHLLQYALSLLDNVTHYFPESNFPRKALVHMVDHILSLPLKQFMSNVNSYLAILERASEICTTECKPYSILRLLQKVLQVPELCEESVWEFGNNILTLCQTFLKYHDVHKYYYDLADVLFLISQNVDDVDVKDRAKIYYSMLTVLSKTKIQSIFTKHSSNSDSKHPLTPFVPGANSSLQYSSFVQILPESILQIVRADKVFDSNCDSALEDVPDLDIMKVYKDHLESYKAVLSLPFILKYNVCSEKKFDKLYSVVIFTSSQPECGSIPVIEIPVFKKSEAESNAYTLNLDVSSSQPLKLEFRIQFSTNNGHSYVCCPEPICLSFKDFFHPLCTPSLLKNSKSLWKEDVFKTLWDELEFDIKNVKTSQACKSIFCLKNHEDLSLFVEKYWRNFVVSKTSDNEYCIAVFFPPKNHLLMKLNVINNRPFVNILIDDCSILPWLAPYLEEIG